VFDSSMVASRGQAEVKRRHHLAPGPDNTNADLPFGSAAILGSCMASEAAGASSHVLLGLARLQTLDNGAPVRAFQVAREMGHDGDSLVRQDYGHLGEIRHRSEAVEYRVEQHATALKDHLATLFASH
jgi:hypothetical protein